MDGTLGRVALIYPVRVWANWDGHALIRMSDTFQDVRLPSGELVSAAGNSSMFAAMLRSISHDGPLATEVALAGVALLVVILFRNIRSAVLVLASLLTGMLWMGGAGAALGLKLNFLNFVALPITLGIGVDYAVNIFARLGAEPAGRHAARAGRDGERRGPLLDDHHHRLQLALHGLERSAPLVRKAGRPRRGGLPAGGAPLRPVRSRLPPRRSRRQPSDDSSKS